MESQTLLQVTLARRTGLYETFLTLELKGGALARGDISADLANVCERDGDLFLVTTGDAVREDMDVITALDQIERGLEDTHV